MAIPAVIHILCAGNPSFGTVVVNGLLAWAGMLGGGAVFFSGLPAAVAMFVPSRPESLTIRINRGLGQGFVVGMLTGPLTFVLFVTRIVS